MKFDFIIGNPPYQEKISKEDGNSSLSKQLFPSFVQESIKLNATQTMLITPSRWFTADAQDKSFIKLREYFKKNNHIKDIHHFPNAKDVFPGVEIAGGVSFFLYDQNYTGDVRFAEYNSKGKIEQKRPLFEDGLDIILSMSLYVDIIDKVKVSNFESLTKITKGRNAFGIVGKRKILEEISKEDSFEGAYEVRCAYEEIRYIDESYILKNLDIANSFKVFISKGNGGAGTLNNEKAVYIIGKPYIGEKKSVCTDSLIPIGNFSTKYEAKSLQKYLMTRFVRFIIGILKVSQNVSQNVYQFVPLQNFKPDSDIDWSQTVADIDKQLYKKYKLSQEEIDFIETHVKEME